MLRAEVWAPRARRVELLLPGAAEEMAPIGDGWFRADTSLAPGDDYGFRVDGSEPLPDPRSHCQPRGVFGPSRVVDHDAFTWSDTRWRGFYLPSALLYELHVGSFSPQGTFAGAIEQLDHLVALGVDAIEIMPIAAFDGDRGWGYDGVSLYAVHQPYGGPNEFKRLVDAAHARGIGVVLDVVYNHFGPTGNHLERFGPYLTDRHRTPWGSAVNFDGENSGAVRRFITDNARHWFDRYHVDALRLDAVHFIVDESDRHILNELSEATESVAAHLGRPLWLVAEYPRTETNSVLPREIGGHGLHAEWRDEVHHSIHAWLTGERTAYYADFGRVADVAEAMTGPKENIPRQRFVVCAQNHDQVGNRPAGQRLCHLVDTRRAKAAAALVICSPFVPLLFMGEEWAASTPFPYFAAPRNPELDHKVRTGRTRELIDAGWDTATMPDPIATATFESARLRWDEIDEPSHAEMRRWYRDLIRLRRERPELADPRPSSTMVDEHESEDSIVMWRGDTAIAVNLGADPLHLALEGDCTVRRILLANDPAVALTETGVQLPPGSVAIVGA